MNPRFKKDVRRSFSYLFEKYGFVFVPIVNDCDGEVVIAKSDSLRLRFIHDRSYVFLDINNTLSANQWIGFYEFLNKLKKSGKIAFNYKYSNNIKAISKLLSLCLPTIQNSEPNT